MVGPSKSGNGQHEQGKFGPVTGSWYCKHCNRLIDVGYSRHGCDNNFDKKP